jgi:hypothetical protein
MTQEPTKPKAAPPAAPPSGAAAATGYLLDTASGKVLPDTPETRAALGDRARPATDFDVGVAGIMQRER